ncbi:helix-turn-helix domain-containing protein [Nocardia sp. NPDC051750]|uniref:helix-turn-helix domain-containing protein n=1 Tax=Nocardia sp. NPDC051750 TaxID=3364325 RepID=UPI0037B6ACBE
MSGIACGVVRGPMLPPATRPQERVQRLGVVPAITDLMTTVLAAGPATREQIQPRRGALDGLLRSLGTRYFALTLPAHPVAHEAVASSRTLDELAALRHISVRHVQRLFLAETGLPFTRWRARARLDIAITRLRGGDSRTVAAHLAGYVTRGGPARGLASGDGDSGDSAVACAAVRTRPPNRAVPGSLHRIHEAQSSLTAPIFDWLAGGLAGILGNGAVVVRTSSSNEVHSSVFRYMSSLLRIRPESSPEPQVVEIFCRDPGGSVRQSPG